MTASTSADTLRLPTAPVLARDQSRCARVPSCPPILGVESCLGRLSYFFNVEFLCRSQPCILSSQTRVALARPKYEVGKRLTTGQSP